jgi:selenocysteine lyase/cysteine desulfurase
MRDWNPFPEATLSHYVEVLKSEPQGTEAVALLVASRRVTPSLSGWDFQACRLVFSGCRTYGSYPRASLASTAVFYEREENAGDGLHCFVIAGRSETYEVVAAGWKRVPLDEAALGEARNEYARRNGLAPATLFVLSSSAPSVTSQRIGAGMNAPAPLETLRSQFPICARMTYLACCSAAPPSLLWQRAIEAFWEDTQEGSNWNTWIGTQEQVRSLFAQLLRAASPRQIALLPSVSAAQAALAHAFHPGTLPAFGKRKKVLISTEDFPTVGAIWRHQEVHGLQVIPVPERAFRDQALLETYLDEQVLWVCISHVSYRDGFRHDLGRLIALAHAYGAFVCIDDYQACGTYVLDVEQLGAEVVMTGTHKYLLCPAGNLACMYVRDDLIPCLCSTTAGWVAQEGFLQQVFQQSGVWMVKPGENIWNPFSFRYHSDARRLEGSTAPILGVYFARAALQLLLDVGLDAIEAQLQAVTTTLVTGAQSLGFRLKTPLEAELRGPMVVLSCQAPEELEHCLAAQQIKVADSRGDGLRLSCHGFTHRQDALRVLDALEAHRQLLVADAQPG